MSGRADQVRADQVRADQVRADPSTTPHPGPPHPPAGSGDHGRELWPRDFGRDGVSGLVSLDRAMRSRDVSRPSTADETAAEVVLADLLARIEGRPRTEARARPARPASGPSQPVPQPPHQR